MSLRQQDEWDLAGLASGCGSPESDARARRLIETNPEAAAFSRQIMSLAAALEDEGETPPALSAGEADALANTIAARMERHRSTTAQRPFRVWRWGAAAAAVLGGAITWYALSPGKAPAVAEVISISPRMALNQERSTYLERTSVRAGEPVQTRDKYAVLKLAGGGRIALATDTRVTLLLGGEEVNLDRGTIFVEAVEPIRIAVAGAMVTLGNVHTEVMIQARPDQPACRVHAGRATISLAGRDIPLSEGQLGAWPEASGNIVVNAFDGARPEWASRSFEAAKAP